MSVLIQIQMSGQLQIILAAIVSAEISVFFCACFKKDEKYKMVSSFSSVAKLNSISECMQFSRNEKIFSIIE